MKDSGSEYVFKDQLSNVVICVNLEVGVFMVKEENFDRFDIVFIDDPYANIDHVFGSEGRPGDDTTVCSRENCKEETNVNQELAMYKDSMILSR